MRRIQRLCGLQLVWLLFLDSKWQTARQTILFCGVSRNDEAIRRAVLSAVYRNLAIALRSINNYIFGSCPEEHLAFVSDHKRLCTAAVLVGNWRTTCIACLSSPQVANHKSSLSLVDLSIVCGWAVALFCTKTLQMYQELPRQVAWNRSCRSFQPLGKRWLGFWSALSRFTHSFSKIYTALRKTICCLCISWVLFQLSRAQGKHLLFCN